MPDDVVALLFPGQGSQDEKMLDDLANLEPFRTRYAAMQRTIGFDLLAGSIDIHSNVTGSLVIVLAGVVSLDLWRRSNASPAAIAGMAGYSMGQWIALYAAGAVEFDQLVRIVHRRAMLMDECASANPGRMIAVIGVSETALETFCAGMRDRGFFVAIANYNAAGQYTLSMEMRAATIVAEGLQTLKPMKTIALQTAGPWHSELMRSAGEAFAQFLESEDLRLPRTPTIDNVTGDFFSADVASYRKSLADHLFSPVRWSRGIDTLVSRGATRFIEVGHGNMLTKFGFFINRNVQHVSFHPLSV
ncbi:MAG: ACP S-malonyltransferase [bacterium]